MDESELTEGRVPIWGGRTPPPTSSLVPSAAPTRTPTVSMAPSEAPTRTPTVSMAPSVSMEPSASMEPSVSMAPSMSNVPSMSVAPSVSMAPTEAFWDMYQREPDFAFVSYCLAEGPSDFLSTLPDLGFQYKIFVPGQNISQEKATDIVGDLEPEIHLELTREAMTCDYNLDTTMVEFTSSFAPAEVSPCPDETPGSSASCILVSASISAIIRTHLSSVELGDEVVKWFVNAFDKVKTEDVPSLIEFQGFTNLNFDGYQTADQSLTEEDTTLSESRLEQGAGQANNPVTPGAAMFVAFAAIMLVALIVKAVLRRRKRRRLLNETLEAMERELDLPHEEFVLCAPHKEESMAEIVQEASFEVAEQSRIVKRSAEPLRKKESFEVAKQSPVAEKPAKSLHKKESFEVATQSRIAEKPATSLQKKESFQVAEPKPVVKKSVKPRRKKNEDFTAENC